MLQQPLEFPSHSQVSPPLPVKVRLVILRQRIVQYLLDKNLETNHRYRLASHVEIIYHQTIHIYYTCLSCV